ncbi:hypothetical protein SP40_12 [Salmonella phage 40]|nr:hypothetical protein SP40_12 [Salmonella phage 40]
MVKSQQTFLITQTKIQNAYVVSNETGAANIEFEVKKDNSKDPNKGYVTLYNLSDETVSYLDANQRESIAIVLEAGFDGENQMLFSGTVEFVQDKWDGHTRQTKMILGDATTNIMTAKTARSYKKGTPLDTVLNDLISDLKLPIGKVVKFGAQTLQQSMAFTGNAANNLERLAKNTGSTFSVQDGAVYWTTQGKDLKLPFLKSVLNPVCMIHQHRKTLNQPNAGWKRKVSRKRNLRRIKGRVVLRSKRMLALSW